MPQSTNSDATVPEPHKLGLPATSRATDDQEPMPNSPDPQSPPPNRGKNPLLYELAEVVRNIRIRWTIEPKKKSQESSEKHSNSSITSGEFWGRFGYALAGAATYLAGLFYIRGIREILDILNIISTGVTPDGTGAMASLRVTLAPLINIVIPSVILLALFFAFILSKVEKNRGPVALYLEGVALPAITLLIIRYSLGIEFS